MGALQGIFLFCQGNGGGLGGFMDGTVNGGGNCIIFG